MIKLRYKSPAFHPLLLVAMATVGVQPLKAQTKLDEYIKQGLTSNQSIKQQTFMLEKNVYALQEAKSMFLPNISFSTAYVKADGGRNR
jgi:outer membrane protein TolC